MLAVGESPVEKKNVMQLLRQSLQTNKHQQQKKKKKEACCVSSVEVKDCFYYFTRPKQFSFFFFSLG